MITCHACQPPRELPGTTLAEFTAHYDRTHGHLSTPIPDLNSWRTRALAEVRRLASTGRDFQLWQVFREVGDPPNHKANNGALTNEIEHMGLAHVVGYGKSTRPESKGSAVAIWRGGPKPRQETNAA
jgi:hypothetical protein